MRVRNFGTKENGNIAIALAFALIPMIGVVGWSIDFIRRNHHAVVVQNAIDAAALHGINSMDEDDTDYSKVIESATQVYKLNVGNIDDYIDGDVKIEPDTSRFKVTFIGTSKNIFMPFWATKLPIIETSVAAAEPGKVMDPTEFVIVLDATFSLGFNSARDVVDEELTRLFEKAYGDDGVNEKLLTTIVPFSDRMNVGSERYKWADIDNKYTWNGCIYPRPEPTDKNAFRLTDTPPKDLRFSQTSGYEKVKLSERQTDQNFREHITCALKPILGPTTDAEELKNFIDTYELTGSGRHDVGLAWAWRYLSPSWQGLFEDLDYPSDYGDRRKVVLFVNDGHSRTFCREVNSHIDEDGFAELPPEFDDECINEITDEGFANIVDVCNAMKSNGIEIYVLYINGVSRGEDAMRECASNGQFLRGDNVDELANSMKDVYMDIAAEMPVLVQ